MIFKNKKKITHVLKKHYIVKTAFVRANKGWAYFELCLYLCVYIPIHTCKRSTQFVCTRTDLCKPENVATSDTQNIRWKTESSKKKKRADWLKLMKPALETIDLRDFF